MHKSFDAKSPRVKSLCFHPRRPWILAGLYTGTIQLWDYRIKSLIASFTECEGPVRCVSFHNDQPLFVSAGDDYKIRVWNYQQKRCLFVLLGHMDYVRTVYFHHEYPWILSASDDQTVKIWNWQSRKCILTLPGHNHYVMCAKFHPTDPLVLSCSLDQTIKLWDLSVFVKKFSAPKNSQYSPSFDGGHPLNITATLDLTSSLDAFPHSSIEAHSRAVNWVAFHDKEKILLSASDDKQVKLWRYSTASAWEIDGCRGHLNNVSCAEFIPKLDLAVSVSEDKSIRLWDVNKCISIAVYRSDNNDRFWCVSVHPNSNLIACGHDNGFSIYKLHNNRPPFQFISTTNDVFFIKNNTLYKFDLIGVKYSKLASLKPSDPRYLPKNLSYNPTSQSLIISNCIRKKNSDHLCIDMYEFDSNFEKFTSYKKLSAKYSYWLDSDKLVAIARDDKVVILTKSLQELSRPDISQPVLNIYPGWSVNQLMCSTKDHFIIYDLETNRVVTKINVPYVRRILMSPDKTKLALFTKNSITIFDRNSYKQLAHVKEVFHVKSGSWLNNQSAVLIYSTITHIKYIIALTSDIGILRTLDSQLYMITVFDDKLYGFDSECQPRVFKIDTTEIIFKLALINRQFDQVTNLIQTSELIGQSLISFLQKKGYAELALHYIKDKSCQFDLSLQCCNISVALEAAKSINKPNIWLQLAQFSKFLGQFKTSIFCYNSIKSYEDIFLLAISSGDMVMIDKLKKLTKSYQHYNTYIKILLLTKNNNDIYKMLVDKNLQILSKVFHDNYFKSDNDMDSYSATIKDENYNKVVLPKIDEYLETKTLEIKCPFIDDFWPLHKTFQSVFGMIPSSNIDVRSTTEQQTLNSFNNANGTQVTTTSSSNALDPSLGRHTTLNDIVDNISADFGSGTSIQPSLTTNNNWNIDDTDLDLPSDDISTNDIYSDAMDYCFPSAFSPENNQWISDCSPLLKFIALGNFTQVSQILAERGVVDISNMKNFIINIHNEVKLFLCTTTPNVVIYSYPPVTKFTIENLKLRVEDAFAQTTAANFTVAIETFTDSIWYSLLIERTDRNIYTTINSIAQTCKEYIIGLKMELLKRESIKNDDIKRACELALYFCHMKMNPTHTTLALRTTMSLLYKNKNYNYCLIIAKRLLAISQSTDITNQAKKVIAACEKYKSNAFILNFEEFKPFRISVDTYTPIYTGEVCLCCSICEAYYQTDTTYSKCCICQVGKLLRSHVA